MLALRAPDRVRSRAFALQVLISVLLAEGRIGEACESTRTLIRTTRTLGSVPVRLQLRGLDRQFAEHDGDPRARAVRAELQM